MNKTIYKQTDPRWARLPFPTGGYNIAGCGCGCLSVTHVLMEVPIYKNYTPKDVQPYMKKWATYQGLIHDGISDSLKHFGMDVVYVGESDPMDKAWKYLDKGLYNDGVLLFYGWRYNKKKQKVWLYGPDGTQWTSSGHFIAFTGYRKVGKKHWFYLKDSGLRISWHKDRHGKRVKSSHSGWWCYEDSMRGCVPKLWLAKFPGAKIEKKSEKPAPKKVEAKKVAPKSKASVINDTAVSLAWPIGTKSSEYAYKSGKPTEAFKKARKHYFPRLGNNGCHIGVFTVLAKAGYPAISKFTWPHIFKYLKKNFTEIKCNHTEAQFKPGDIFIYERRDKNGKKHNHIAVIVEIKGKLYIAEARQSKSYFHINKSLKKALKKYNVGSWIYRAKEGK